MNSQTPNAWPCAVQDCEDRGRPHVCPYDGRYHHHGMIHYGTIPSALVFPGPRWEYVCDTHYKVLEAELAERRARNAKVAEAVEFIRAGFGTMRESFLSDPGGYLDQVGATFDDATAAEAIRLVSEEWAESVVAE